MKTLVWLVKWGVLLGLGAVFGMLVCTLIALHMLKASPEPFIEPVPLVPLQVEVSTDSWHTHYAEDFPALQTTAQANPQQAGVNQ